jgi:3-phenylpropionate/cinnamic acid dioxygenase small subunit
MTAEHADDMTARELERLAFRYAATLDNRDGPGFAALFAEKAVLTMVRRRRDADEVMSSWTGHAELAQIPEGLRRNLRTLHLVGNRLYEVAGDEATGQVYCVAHHIDDSGAVPVDRVLYIRYRDTYRRADGASWRFQERFIEIEWSQTSFAEI